jgi:phosphohistidine swiveling domain-containing protein
MTTRTPEHRPRQSWQPVPKSTPAQYLFSLEEEATRDLVGGKAFGLMLANRAGFTVPSGFVISTEAFDVMVDLVVPMVHSTEELREAIRVEPLPARLLAEIEEATDRGKGRWAVRSSAYDEDGRRSFAGQQTTVLNVTGLDDLVDAVRQVWASLYDPMALMYRARLALDGLPGSMAVVVQRMVEPRVAGVVFSRNPVALELAELVVSATPGLGTVVVDGDACDTYYLERPSGYLLRSELVDKGVLTLPELEKLANLALRTEGLLAVDGAIPGADVEWAIADDVIYVLQARQITGHRGDAIENIVWSNANVGEALPGVATPMTWSVLKDFSTLGFERAFGALGLDVPEDAELVGSFHGRIYLNLTEFVSIASAIPILDPTMLYSMAGGSGASVLKNITRRSSTSFITRLPTTIPRILATQVSMPMVAKIWETYFDQRCESFFERELYRMSHRAMLDELQMLDRLFNMTGQIMLSVSSNFLMSYVLTSEFLTWFGSEESHGREKDLLSDLGVKSAEPGQHLLELGRIARRSKRLRRIIGENPSDQVLGLLMKENQHEDVKHFLDELEEFRVHFGHRAPREAELATPRWRENLSFAFDVLKGILNSSHVASPREVARNREDTTKSASELIDRAFAPGVRSVFRAVLQVTRLNARMRESTRARVVDALDMYRHFLLECGRRMVQTGVLHKAEDVFFLKKPEVQGWLNDITIGRGFKRRVIVRRAVFEAFEEMPDPPATFVMRGEERIAGDLLPEEPAISGQDQHFNGLPASSGRVTGRARVIMSSKDAVMQPGEILVVPYADVGWTPLFVGASAVVMGLGGPLSHAAIVAREFHIPAVVSVPGICDLIQTGDLITIDGDRGTVTRRNPA